MSMSVNRRERGGLRPDACPAGCGGRSGALSQPDRFAPRAKPHDDVENADCPVSPAVVMVRYAYLVNKETREPVSSGFAGPTAIAPCARRRAGAVAPKVLDNPWNPIIALTFPDTRRSNQEKDRSWWKKRATSMPISPSNARPWPAIQNAATPTTIWAWPC